MLGNGPTVKVISGLICPLTVVSYSYRYNDVSAGAVSGVLRRVTTWVDRSVLTMAVVTLDTVISLKAAAVCLPVVSAALRAERSVVDRFAEKVLALLAAWAASREADTTNVYRSITVARSMKGTRNSTNKSQSAPGVSAITEPRQFLMSEILCVFWKETRLPEVEFGA